MTNAFLQFLQGYVKVKVSGINKERFFNLCRNHNLNMWKVKKADEECTFYIEVCDFKKLKDIRKKSSCRVKILERHGTPFFVNKYSKRVMFFGGIILFFILTHQMSLYIWNISLEGNYSYTEDIILEKLEENGITHGIHKSGIVGSDIERLIRNTYPDITWVSTELKGTRLIIHIKENFDRTISDKEEKPYNILSGKKAVITSIITRAGTPLVQAGDEVEKDSVLVSGKIEILGDDGAVTATDYVPADADVYGKVIYPYSDEMPLDYVQKKYTGKSKKAFSIGTAEDKLNITGLPVKYEKFDMVSETYQAHIFDNFYLPLYFVSYKYNEYITENRKYSEDEAIKVSQGKLERFLKEMQEKGIQIIQNDVKIEVSGEKCIASGNITAVECLGEVQYITDEMMSSDNSEEGNQDENERD